MKSYKVIILILFIVSISIIITLLTLYKFHTNNVNKLLEDEEKQVEILDKIYQDFIKNFNTEYINIKLDESALKNILTNDNFNEDNITKLKNIEKKYENSQVTYTLSIQYSYSTQELNVKFVRSGYEPKMQATQKYKIYTQNDEIIYDRVGYGTILQE